MYSLLSLFFVGIAAFAGYHYYRQGSSRGMTVAWIAVLVLASGTWLAVLSPGSGHLDPPTLELTMAFGAVVASLGLAYSSSQDHWDGEEYGKLRIQWFVALVVLALGIRFSPASALFILPIMAAVPPRQRAGGGFKALVALAVLIVVAHALLAYLLGVRLTVAPSLVAWNLAYLIAGRNLGLVIWFVPVLVLLAGYRRDSGRGWLLTSVVLATLVYLLSHPYQLLGAEQARFTVGFLPIYGALWFVPTRAPKAGSLIVTVILAGLSLWPAWLAPLETARGEDRPALHDLSLASRLLYETSQEAGPHTAQWQGTGVLSRALGPGLVDGDRGPALVPAAGPAHLMIAAEKPLEAVLLDFGPEAATELRVSGGTTGNTVFRPDGGVRFEIVLEAPDRTHPMWFSPKRHYVYLLEIEMPDAPDGALPVAIMARPEGALPRSLDPATAGRER